LFNAKQSSKKKLSYCCHSRS